MDFANSDVINYLKSMGLPDSRLLINGEIANLYTLLEIEPTFHADGSRVLTPYEILGVLPKFSKDGKEIPIVFAIKGKCRKSGKYEGHIFEFLCKNKRVKEKKNTLEELKFKYKQAVLDGNEAQAKELFELIDSLSGGNAKQLLSSFFDYTKYYKKLKKQLLIDLFAHFFMLYISSMVKAAKGGVIRKNKIFKPFKSGIVEMTSSPKQVQENVYNAPVNEVLQPEKFGINNLKSITIEQKLPDYGERTSLTIENQGATAVPLDAQLEKQETIATQTRKEENKKNVEGKTFAGKMKDFLSGNLLKQQSQKQKAFEENSNFFETGFGNVDYLNYDQGNRNEFYDDLSFEQAEAMQMQFGDAVLNSPEFEEFGLFDENQAEPERNSVLKKKKRVSVKKFGTEFDSTTKETKTNDSENKLEESREFDA